MTKPDQFSWMREAIYEPRQTQFDRVQPRRVSRIFIYVCVLAIVCGALVAVSL